ILSTDMLDQRPMRDIARRNLESINAKLVEKVGTFFIERRGQEFDADPFCFFMQRAKRLVGQFQLLEQLLTVSLIVRMAQLCGTCGRQPNGAKRLKLDCIGSCPLRSSNKSQSPFLVSSMIQTGFRNDVNTIRICGQQTV